MFKELKLVKRSQEKSDDFYTNVTSTRLRYLLGRHDILRWINIVSLMKLIKAFYKHEYLCQSRRIWIENINMIEPYLYELVSSYDYKNIISWKWNAESGKKRFIRKWWHVQILSVVTACKRRSIVTERPFFMSM